MLEELKREVLNGTKPLGEAITRALPLFKGKLAEHKISFLVNEYQGYEPIAMAWYKNPTKEHPSYRVVSGSLKMMQTGDGLLSDVKHPLAGKEQFFLSAPINWLEQSIQLEMDPTMVEMSEMGRSPTGIIVCVTANSNVQRIVDVVKQSFLAFIDEADMA